MPSVASLRGLNSSNRREIGLVQVEQFDSLLSSISVAPFDVKAAGMFGKLSQQFPNRKSSFDRMIAAHALALNATLVTNNTADFTIYDLNVENWVG